MKSFAKFVRESEVDPKVQAKADALKKQWTDLRTKYQLSPQYGKNPSHLDRMGVYCDMMTAQIDYETSPEALAVDKAKALAYGHGYNPMYVPTQAWIDSTEQAVDGIRMVQGYVASELNSTAQTITYWWSVGGGASATASKYNRNLAASADHVASKTLGKGTETYKLDTYRLQSGDLVIILTGHDSRDENVYCHLPPLAVFCRSSAWPAIKKQMPGWK